MPEDTEEVEVTKPPLGNVHRADRPGHRRVTDWISEWRETLSMRCRANTISGMHANCRYSQEEGIILAQTLPRNGTTYGRKTLRSMRNCIRKKSECDCGRLVSGRGLYWEIRTRMAITRGVCQVPNKQARTLRSTPWSCPTGRHRASPLTDRACRAVSWV